jgi:hypothetical protein
VSVDLPIPKGVHDVTAAAEDAQEQVEAEQEAKNKKQRGNPNSAATANGGAMAKP